MTYNHITSISSLPFLFWQRFLNWLGLAVVIEIVVIALLFVVGFLVSEHFRTTGNVADIFEQMTGLAFVALGQTVVIITGGIDLSLDATIALTSSLLSGVVNGRADLAAPMIVAVLAIGITIGLVNGALILALRVHPLIITLAVAAVIQGFALLYTLMPIGSMPDGFTYLHSSAYSEFRLGRLSLSCFLVLLALFSSIRGLADESLRSVANRLPPAWWVSLSIGSFFSSMAFPVCAPRSPEFISSAVWESAIRPAIPISIWLRSRR